MSDERTIWLYLMADNGKRVLMPTDRVDHIIGDPHLPTSELVTAAGERIPLVESIEEVQETVRRFVEGPEPETCPEVLVTTGGRYSCHWEAGHPGDIHECVDPARDLVVVWDPTGILKEFKS